MRELLTPLLFFQRFIVPTILILLVWSIWRTVFKKDFAVGLGLYVSLVVLVDGFFNTGLYIPGLEKGSIRYSELCALFLLFQRPPAPQSPRLRPRRPAPALCGHQAGRPRRLRTSLGVTMLTQLRPAIVLLDIALPDSDGFAVAEVLAQLAAPPAVVLVSSRDRSAYGRRIETAQVRGFLPKRLLSGAAIARLVG